MGRSFQRNFTHSGAQRQTAPARPVSQSPSAPMTLANVRANGVRALIVECRCGRQTDVNVDAMDGAVFVPVAGRRMVCSACGARGARTMPAWHTAKRPGMGEQI